MTTTHTPVPISENPVYTGLQVAEQKMHMVYGGKPKDLLLVGPKPKGLLLVGPPGIGKTQLGERIARLYGLPWIVEEPGSAVGLRQVLSDYKDEKSLQLDDTGDALWTDKLSLNLLKHALDSKDVRHIPGYTVGGGKSVAGFDFHATTIVYTNTDPSTLRKLKKDIDAVLDRCQPVIIPDDPLMILEYTGWLATEGGMLRGMVAQNAARCEIQMSMAAANDVLEHYCTHAARYPSISPRALDMSARMRLEAGAETWRAHQDAKLLREPRWTLPAKLHRFCVDWRHNVEMPAETPAEAGRPSLVSIVEQIKARQQSKEADGDNGRE